MSLSSHTLLPLSATRQRGVTLIELMVGMLIGLLAVIVISQVLLVSEGQTRTTTAGADAQVNGALALYTLQRDVQMAGYGLISSPGVVGCPINARFNGAAPTGFPTQLAPVVITRESDRPAGSIGDAIRVLASSKASFSVPTRVVTPGFAIGGVYVPVAASLGLETGDLALAAVDATQPCWVFQVTGLTAPGTTNLPRADDATKWNPANPVAYGDGSVLLNLGTLVDNTYQIVGNTLQLQSFDVNNPNTRTATDIQPDVINMKAMYGKDIDADGAIDVWNDVAPTTNAEWLQVLAIRVAIVTRSGQYEKGNVTSANPAWNVGNAPPTTGATACGTSKCLTLKVDHLTDWKHYRYKLFDTVIPLRNMLWKS